MKKQHEILFSPMKVGGVTIKNRFVHAPMSETPPISTSTHQFNAKARDYLVGLAKNNVGLIIPGVVTVMNVPGNKLYEQVDLFHNEIKALMDEIHSYGTKFFLQLGAGFGRVLIMPDNVQKIIASLPNTYAQGFDIMSAGPSAGLPNVWAPWIKRREITKEEIKEIIDAFVKSAVLCKEVGIDGIEIHAVHEGYLLDQFTIANTNNRNDEYGGSLENRARFTTEIIRGIKEACGEDYPVIVRYSVTSKMRGFNKGAIPGEEFEEFGRDYEESIALAKILEEAGADALDADNGSYDSWFWAHPPVYMPLACNLDDAAFIKKHVNIPVFCAGRMENPDISSKAISEEKIDGVTIGRQFLADIEYIPKLMNGKIDDIRPCIACHNGCFQYGAGKEGTVVGPISHANCALNPTTMHEKEKAVIPAEVKKNVVVVGGGIGGMEVARVAALRGHSVSLYEKTNKLGGVFIAAAAPDFKEKDKMLLKWYEKQIKDLNVDIHMNTEITPNTLETLNADEIIIATGANKRTLSLDTDHSVEVMDAIDYLCGTKDAGENLVIVGGGLTGCETAYDAVLKGKKPVIVEMMDDILNLPTLCASNSNMLREIIRYYNIPVYTKSKVKAVESGHVIIETADGLIRVPADNIVTSIGYNAGTIFNTEKMHVVGDADHVGNLLDVIWKAHDVARSL